MSWMGPSSLHSINNYSCQDHQILRIITRTLVQMFIFLRPVVFLGPQRSRHQNKIEFIRIPAEEIPVRE